MGASGPLGPLGNKFGNPLLGGEPHLDASWGGSLLGDKISFVELPPGAVRSDASWGGSLLGDKIMFADFCLLGRLLNPPMPPGAQHTTPG